MPTTLIIVHSFLKTYTLFCPVDIFDRLVFPVRWILLHKYWILELWYYEKIIVISYQHLVFPERGASDVSKELHPTYR